MVNPSASYQQASPLPSGDSRPPRALRLWAALLALASVAVFASSWQFTLLGWDDDINVLQNPLVRLPVATGLWRIFTGFFSTDYYPLTYLSLAADHWLWGGNLAGYHVTQTLLHGVNVFLVALLAWRWTQSTGVALTVAAWWAWHPVQVETVAWLAERKNVLGTCFVLLAWLAYLHNDRRGRLWALALFTGAVLSHALVIVLPVLLIADELRRGTTWRETWRRTWLLFLPAAFAALMRVVGHGKSGQLTSPFRTGGEGALTMIKVVGDYLTALVWPVGLSNHYTVTAVTDATGVWVTALWAALGLVWWWQARDTRRWTVFAAIWFLVALAPVLQFVPHPTLRADRYLYLAALGPLVLAAVALNRRPRWLAVVGPVATAALLCGTLAYLPVWRDAKSLWTDCTAKNPRDVVAHFSLAGCAVTEQDWPTAEHHLREAVRLKPSFAEAHERLGGVLAAQGRYAEARRELERALELKPHLTEARDNLRLLP